MTETTIKVGEVERVDQPIVTMLGNILVLLFGYIRIMALLKNGDWRLFSCGLNIFNIMLIFL